MSENELILRERDELILPPRDDISFEEAEKLLKKIREGFAEQTEFRMLDIYLIAHKDGYQKLGVTFQDIIRYHGQHRGKKVEYLIQCIEKMKNGESDDCTYMSFLMDAREYGVTLGDVGETRDSLNCVYKKHFEDMSRKLVGEIMSRETGIPAQEHKLKFYLKMSRMSLEEVLGEYGISREDFTVFLRVRYAYEIKIFSQENGMKGIFREERMQINLEEMKQRLAELEKNELNIL